MSPYLAFFIMAHFCYVQKMGKQKAVKNITCYIPFEAEFYADNENEYKRTFIFITKKLRPYLHCLSHPSSKKLLKLSKIVKYSKKVVSTKLKKQRMRYL